MKSVLGILLLWICVVISQTTDATEDLTLDAASETINTATTATELGTEDADSETDVPGSNAPECEVDSTPEATTDATDTPTEEEEQQKESSSAASTTITESESESEGGSETSADSDPVQSGPFIDLLGTTLYSLEMVDETHAQIVPKYTNEALSGKKVIGLYFSADWCGPCRQFTPELVSFYNKMNGRRGKKDQFEIVWVSRCRDANSFAQYFTHMGGWYALPVEEALGQRGEMLSNKYKVKGIPTLILLDEVGNVITTDARNKIPQDKAGIGFPWRNPIASIYVTLVPKSLRLMVKSQITELKQQAVMRLKGLIGLKQQQATAAS